MNELSEGILTANGTKIHYYRSGDNKNKPTLLLLHGITDSGQCWAVVNQELANSYDVIMPDARGHGHSEGIETGFSVELLIEDTTALIRELGLVKPFVYGHSMGALTAAAVAAKYPGLVRAIVLEDPPLLSQFDGQIKHTQAYNDMLEGMLAYRKMLIAFKLLSPEQQLEQGKLLNPGWAEEELIPWAASKAEVNLEVFDNNGEIISYPWRKTFEHIDCPILLITAGPEKKSVVTPEVAQEFSRIWKHGEVQHVSRAGHNIHRDRFEETMAVVKYFLNSH